MPSSVAKSRRKSSRTTRPAAAHSQVKRHEQSLSERTRKWMNREIDFIASPEFTQRGAERRILGNGSSEAERQASRPKTSMPRDLPAHLARLCEAQLLTAEEERDLFRRMNFLKYRANVLRSRLNPARPSEDKLTELKDKVEEASRVRDRIIQANMRLVISIVKKFVTPKHSFDELLSDGIVSLMHAVDKFDYDKGFRFSTYAYRAIARNAYRTITDQHKEDSRFDASVSDDLMNLPEEEHTSSLGEQEWIRMRGHLATMMQHLDRREKFIVRGRFALGAHRKVRTFQCLADKLGVSKERVRQLEQRAIAKLQAMAAEVDVEVLA